MDVMWHKELGKKVLEVRSNWKTKGVETKDAEEVKIPSSALSCWVPCSAEISQRDLSKFKFSLIKTSHDEIENTVGERIRI